MAKTRKVKINITNFVDDIRAGFTDQQLMEKYSMAKQSTLLKAFDKLVESGRVTEEELHSRSPFIDTQSIVDFLGSSKAISELDD
jgi:hypothetical protein